MALEVLEIEPPLGVDVDEPHLRRPGLPRQQVCVVLHDRGENDRFRRPERTRDLVQPFRGVADEHDGLAFGIGTHESAYCFPRCLVRVRADLAFEARAAVHARIPGCEPLNRVAHRHERRRARRVVQIDVAAATAIERRHQRIGPDDFSRPA